MENPQFEQVSKCYSEILKTLERVDMREFLEIVIQKSTGKLRVVRSAFGNPDRLVREYPNVYYQALEQWNIDQWYPQFKEQILNIPSDKIFYIFDCGEVLTVGSLI
jgi:hypothetical protein